MSCLTKVLVFLATALFMGAPSLHSQTTATIVGVVTDESGGVILNAGVKVINELTGYSRDVETGEDGSYVAPLLPVGTYAVEGSAQGFKTMRRTGVRLSVQEAVRVDLRLPVGSVSDQVTVSGEAPLVDTRQSSVGALMESERMLELPLSGRTPASLLRLIPTVSNLSPGDRPTSYSVNVNVAGNRENNNNFLLDNTRYNSVQYGQGNPLPPPDFLSEFKVTTNAYDAEKGLGSTSIQVITKSGTNQLHGSLFEFHRDNALTARNFFAPRTPFLVQNQFGGTIGGPIKKNSTFFFFGYQGTRIREAVLSNDAYPASEAERGGDFSASRGGAPLDPDNNNQPFAGAQIPQSRWDPAAVNYLSKLPGPNRADGRFEILRPRKEDGTQISVKVDHNLFRNNLVSARYWRHYGKLVSPLGNLPAGEGLYTLHFQNLGVTDTHTFGPTLINVFSIGWNRKFETSTNQNMIFNTPKEAGVNLPDPQVTPYPPFVGVTGRMSVSPRIAGVPLRLDNTWDYADTVTWIKGRRTWKFGGEYHPIRFGPGLAAFDNGNFTFNGQYSKNAMADFLIGRPSFLQLLRERENHRTSFLGIFAHNDVRINSRFTLNVGVRYHYEEPTYQADNLSANFIPGMQSQRIPNAPPGLVYAGDPGIPKGIFNADKNNFNPRVGFAWDLFGDGRTSVRAGFGIFTVPYPNGLSQFISLNLPFLPVFNLDTVPSFSDPFRGRTLGFGIVPNDPIEMYNPSTGQAVFLLPATGWSIDPNFPNAYVQQYSVSIQRQLPQNMALEVSYIGNGGRKLSQGFQFNPAAYRPGATLGNTEQRRRYYPGQVGSMYRNTAGGNSSFNGLATVLRKRFSNSYLLDLNYTWMRSIDDSQSVNGYNAYQNPDNRRADRAVSNWHRSHVFSASWVWDLPRFANSPKATQLILGGWQLGGFVTLQSGLPFTVTAGRDNSLTAVGADRPDLTGDPKLSTDRSRAELIARYFDTSVFKPNVPGTYGNAGRNILIGPGLATVDLGLFKNFHVHESHKFQLRGEFFNLFNRANFSNPNASLVSPAFGRILGAGTARQIQLALKYSF
ncbi:MAG: TonB-dependent receptor [Bryobacteraceae bacterium]|nr:TonB-dependent receptor [Bryobacteraceae bacterium]